MLRSFRPLFIAAALAFSGPALAETVTLTFVQTNDIDRMEEEDGRGGFARLAAVVKAERAKGNPVFFVHSGDTISPSLLSGIDKGAHIIDILNHLDLDVMVPGNHEFDFGPEVFRERLAEAKFPIVSSNITAPDGSAPANTVDTRLVEVAGGVTVGFYGLTTEDTPVVSSPGDYRFAPSIEVGIAKAAALREAGADFVVAVAHTPIDVDFGLVRAGAADLILSGHDEHLAVYFNGRVALTESESQANVAVVTDIALTKTEEDGTVEVDWQPSFRIVDTSTVTPDAEIAALVARYNDTLDAELKVEIGVTETPIDSRRATVRGEEAAIGNLIADAIRAATGAQLAITNAGGIRANKQYAAGQKLTRRDVLSELPFGNATVMVEITGKDVKDAIENGLRDAPQGAGRFPVVSGLKFEADLKQPQGSRVTAITVDGKPIDPAAKYTVASNNFMLEGGDGYAALGRGRTLVGLTDGKLMANEVMVYVRRLGTVDAKVEGRAVLK